jgi:hypothetical protein
MRPFQLRSSICCSIGTIYSGLYFLIGMASFSSKWILSHSTWCKFSLVTSPLRVFAAGPFCDWHAEKLRRLRRILNGCPRFHTTHRG